MNLQSCAPRASLTIFGLATILAGVLGVQVAEAQNAEQTPESSTGDLVVNQIDASQWPMLTVYFTITDAQGVPISDISADNFRVLEDGQPVSTSSVEITDVQATRNPIQIALAMDVSHSMGGVPIDRAIGAAKKFIDELSPGDDVALITFNHNVTYVQTFTDNKNVLHDRINELEAGGGTALYEAIYQAAEAVRDREGRRASVVVTDGWNDSPLPRTLDEAARQSRESQVPVYVLGFGNADDEVLRQVAEETGGDYLSNPTSEDLQDLFVRLTGLLQSQYVLSFESEAPLDSMSHILEIAATGPGGIVRGQKSWFVAPGTMGPTPTITPAPTRAAVPTATPPAQSTDGDRSFLDAWWPLLLAVVLGAAVMSIAFVTMSRREPARYCAVCGRELRPNEKVCPNAHNDDDDESGGDSEPAPGPVAPPVSVDTVIKTPVVHGWLVGLDGVTAGRRLDLRTAPPPTTVVTTIGRADQNDITLNDEHISREHAKIKLEQDGTAFVLYDVAARDSTWVNGVLALKHQLETGDKIRFGSSTFEFHQVEVTENTQRSS